MNILGVQMQDKTALIIGGVGLVLGYLAIKKTGDTITGISTYLSDNFAHPVDSLLANFGVLPDNKGSGTALTPQFDNFINQNGGIDAYIAAHKNGTYKGGAFTPAPAIVPSWYDPLHLLGTSATTGGATGGW